MGDREDEERTTGAKRRGTEGARAAVLSARQSAKAKADVGQVARGLAKALATKQIGFAEPPRPNGRDGTLLQGGWVGSKGGVWPTKDLYAEVIGLKEVESGPHWYGRDRGVGDRGLIYTCRGGFIDIAHVRDSADLTLYATHLARILFPGGKSYTLPPTPLEFAKFEVAFHPVPKPPEDLCRCVGAAIAYHVQTWHEIETWHVSPALLPQRVSSFSPEDNYSNMLGVLVGHEAADKASVFHANEKASDEFNARAQKQLVSWLKRLEPLDKTEAAAIRKAVANDDPSMGWYPVTLPAPSTFAGIPHDNAFPPSLFRRHLGAYGGHRGRMPGHVRPFLVDTPEAESCSGGAITLRFPSRKYRHRKAEAKDLFTLTVTFDPIVDATRRLADLAPTPAPAGQEQIIECADFPKMVEHIGVEAARELVRYVRIWSHKRATQSGKAKQP